MTPPGVWAPVVMLNWARQPGEALKAAKGRAQSRGRDGAAHVALDPRLSSQLSHLGKVGRGGSLPCPGQVAPAGAE